MEIHAEDLPIIQIENADLGYKTEPVPALSEVNLSFYPGDQVAIIGPNGAGKTTLLKTIVGLIMPLKGKVIVHGSCHGAIKNCVSYIPQK